MSCAWWWAAVMRTPDRTSRENTDLYLQVPDMGKGNACGYPADVFRIQVKGLEVSASILVWLEL